jgi:hypothetical protein
MKSEEHLKSLTTMEAIRAKCVDCVGGEFSRITNCTITKCALFPYRHGKMPENRTGINTPLKTIRTKCLACNGTSQEVKLCLVTGCELFQYREGHNPRRKGLGRTAEQMAKIRQGVTNTRPEGDTAKLPCSPPFAECGGHPGNKITES